MSKITSKPIYSHFLHLQKTLLIQAFIVMFVFVMPMMVFLFHLYSRENAKQIFESQRAYLSHLLISNDYLELQRHLNSIVASGLIENITLSESNEKIVLTAFNDNRQMNITGLHDSIELSAAGAKPFLLSWNYRVSIEILFYFVLLSTIGIASIFLFLSYKLSTLGRRILLPVSSLNHFLSDQKSLTSQYDELSQFQSEFLEIDLFRNNFLRLVEKIHSAESKIKSLAKSEAFTSIAEQVSHDIRSPLSALNIVTASLEQIPENKRVLVRDAVKRINDIANDLLSQSKAMKQLAAPNLELPLQTSAAKGVGSTIELLIPLIDGIISEKRIQLRDRLNIELDVEHGSAYGIFVKLNPSEFKRVISNLVENCIDAVGQSGRISVSLSIKEQFSCIRLCDNGKGIPTEILAKLGNERVSFGKDNSDSGNGIGVFHAKSVISSLGGSLMIESSLGVGTTLEILLPLVKPPPWFQKRLVVAKGTKLIILDDDNSIHHIWVGRFQSLNYQMHDISFVHFSFGEEFKKYVSENIASNFICLVDYELLNQNVTGLDVIESLKIFDRAILVTSRYEEDSIRGRCAKLNIPIIPKGMAGLVPIDIKQSPAIYDAVLLDDDPLIHMTWKIVADQKLKSVFYAKNKEELFQCVNDIDRSTSFYIDANLGEGSLGEHAALELYNRGFRNLYFATGDSPERHSHVTWIKGILGKEPPW